MLEARLAQKRQYYARNREVVKAQQAAYRTANRDKIRAQHRAYYLRNIEARRENCRRWHEQHRLTEEFKTDRANRGKEHYRKNKPRIRAQHKAWLKRNPGYMAAVKHRRRLIENASQNLATIKAWMKAVKSKTTAVCYYCQRTIPTKGLHFDHIVAISQGGIHDVSNLCVSCAPCNLTKQDKPVSAWVRIGQQVLSL